MSIVFSLFFFFELSFTLLDEVLTEIVVCSLRLVFEAIMFLPRVPNFFKNCFQMLFVPRDSIIFQNVVSVWTHARFLSLVSISVFVFVDRK